MHIKLFLISVAKWVSAVSNRLIWVKCAHRILSKQFFRQRKKEKKRIKIIITIRMAIKKNTQEIVETREEVVN